MRRALHVKICWPYRGRRQRRDRCYCGAPEPEAVPRPAQWSKRAGGFERDRRELQAAQNRSWAYRLLVSKPYSTTTLAFYVNPAPTTPIDNHAAMAKLEGALGNQ